VRILPLSLGAIIAVAAFSCRSTTASDCAGFEPSTSDMVCVVGTVRYFQFEGGFWAVRGDDSTTYDPLGGLPIDFQHDGLRVRLEARIRSDVGSHHMAGPIVEIIDIRRL
jgi:hypothetical protein